MGAHFNTIHTPRLLMRRWRDGDREPYAAMNADPEVTRFFPNSLTREGSDAHIDKMEALFDRQGFGLWALEVAGTGDFIGFTGLNPMPDDVPGAGGMEVGWRLIQRAWHQGYATEAGAAAVNVAFNGIGLDEIWSMTAVLNEPSQAVMKRLGLTLYTHFEHPRVPDGHPLQPHVAFRRQRGELAQSQLSASQLAPSQLSLSLGAEG
ncbi:MAG TPA: GNAT family N-acetyltransferase [Streptosporangiaceae bacterium]|jgi:RimJ/RimL family protein N-acetyltransferase|nr:GNAT family N-acetyltransferase [Streptosporangiaceae bacterium]